MPNDLFGDFEGIILDSNRKPIKNLIKIGPGRKGGVYYVENPEKPVSEGHPAHLLRVSYGEDCKGMITDDLWRILCKLEKMGKKYTLLTTEEVYDYGESSRAFDIQVILLPPRRVGYIYADPFGFVHIMGDVTRISKIDITDGIISTRPNMSEDQRTEYNKSNYPCTHVAFCFGRDIPGIWSSEIIEDRSDPLCKRSINYIDSVCVDQIALQLMKKHFL
jgi:hypothetical protein